MSAMSRRENLGTGERILDAAWRNPEGLLLLAAGAALLMRRAGVTASIDRGHSEFRPPNRNEETARVGANVRGLGNRVSDAAQVAGDYASDVADRISQTASSYASSVSDYAGEVTDRSRRMAHDAQSSLQSTAQHIFQEQPLAVALVGFAAGAVVAATFPATDMEKRTLGPAGERLKDAAERAGENLREAGSQAGQSLMNAAEERGLTSEGLKEVAREVGEAFSGSLSGEQLSATSTSSRPTSGKRPAEQTGRKNEEASSGHDTGGKRGAR